MPSIMIRLIDLINLAEVEFGDYKIHLATGAKDKSLNAFYSLANFTCTVATNRKHYYFLPQYLAQNVRNT